MRWAARAALALVAGLVLVSVASAHDRRFTAEENAWLERQRAVDGTKCCNEHDAFVGLEVEWRLVGGRYEVRIDGAWMEVLPGRLMRHRAEDPTPWPGQALLFFSAPAMPQRIWCFFPEPLT